MGDYVWMSDSRPPVWLLDVDGVINAVTAKPPPAWPADQWVVTSGHADGATWPIRAARPVLDFIALAHEQGRAEVRWHTTWQHDALALAEALGLPEFGVQDAPEYAARTDALRRGRWWKLPAAQRVMQDEGRSLLWTDDDAAWDLGREQEAYLASLGSLLVVAPSQQTGLCKRHLRLIDEFLPAAEVQS